MAVHKKDKNSHQHSVKASQGNTDHKSKRAVVKTEKGSEQKNTVRYYVFVAFLGTFTH